MTDQPSFLMRAFLKQSKQGGAEGSPSPSPPKGAQPSGDAASKSARLFSRFTSLSSKSSSGKSPSSPFSPFSADSALSVEPSRGSLSSVSSFGKLNSGNCEAPPCQSLLSLPELSMPRSPHSPSSSAAPRYALSQSSFSHASPPDQPSTTQRPVSLSNPQTSTRAPAGRPSLETRQGPDATVLALCPDLPATMARTRWCLEDYDVTSLISQRKTSHVYRATCRASGTPVALKVYQLPQLSMMQTAQLRREISLQTKLLHRNIIRLYAAFQQGSQVVLVQELADSGDLYTMLLKEPGSRMSERRAAECVIRPMLRALEYLHSLGIAHRDVKLENVLVHKGEVKLADFGIAIDLREERGVTRAGTLNYLSPEVLACPFKKHPLENKDNPAIGGYSTQVDVWSLGVLAYECLNGASPFATDSKRQTEDLIARGSLPVFLVANPSEKAVDFVYKCLTLDPLSRPMSRELLSHPYVSRGIAPGSPCTSGIAYEPMPPASPTIAIPVEAWKAGASRPEASKSSFTASAFPYSPGARAASHSQHPAPPPKRVEANIHGGSDSVLHILSTGPTSSAQCGSSTVLDPSDMLLLSDTPSHHGRAK